MLRPSISPTINLTYSFISKTRFTNIFVRYSIACSEATARRPLSNKIQSRRRHRILWSLLGVRQWSPRIIRLSKRPRIRWKAPWRDRGLRLPLESELLRRKTSGESTDPGWSLWLALRYFRPRDILHSLLDLLEWHGHGTAVHRWTFVQREGQILRLAGERRRMSETSWVDGRFSLLVEKSLANYSILLHHVFPSIFASLTSVPSFAKRVTFCQRRRSRSFSLSKATM